MQGIFTRPLRSRGHRPMGEWVAELERLQALCIIHVPYPSHITWCNVCSETLLEVLLTAMQEDTAPLPLLSAVIDAMERRRVA